MRYTVPPNQPAIADGLIEPEAGGRLQLLGVHHENALGTQRGRSLARPIASD
jgi:hypothetical protein